MYNWDNIAARTETAYRQACQAVSQRDIVQRLSRMRACGPIVGLFVIFFATMDALLYRVVQWFSPACDIDIAVDLV